VVYADDPVLLLFGDSEDGLGRAREAAARAGCRVAGSVGIADAPDRLVDQALVHAAIVLADEPSEALDRLLDRLDGETRSGRLRTVVVAPERLIDAVTGPSLHHGIEHLFDPSDLELQAAMAAATASAPSQLHDVRGSNGIAVLQQLSEEAARIAAVLASLSGDEAGLKHEQAKYEAAPRDLGAAPPIDAAYVRSIIRTRRMRDQYFRGEMFADPAFDMLLDLFAARLEGYRVAVSSLCIAAAVPATTALRWIKALTDRGLFVRAADPQDGRRVYIELSEEAAHNMASYLAAVQRSGGTAL
jgi:hypothetical protein